MQMMRKGRVRRVVKKDVVAEAKFVAKHFGPLPSFQTITELPLPKLVCLPKFAMKPKESIVHGRSAHAQYFLGIPLSLAFESVRFC